jgi:glucose-1-phosphate adenylyltransferase
MAKVITIILGGGQGKRLFPLTRDRAKPAVPIGGKFRLVDIPISNALNSGFKEIFVLTQFNSVSLHRHILNTYRFDYFHDASVELLAAEQTPSTTDWFQGTADAVRKHFPHYHLDDDDEVLILSGDHLYRMDLRDILRVLREKKADFIVATVPVKKEEVSEFGIMKLGRDNRITAFKEKPKTVGPEDSFKGSYLASMGIYAFRASVLKEVLGGKESDFGREVIPNSIAKCRAYAYVFQGYWRDIGTIKSFYETSLELTLPDAPFTFGPLDGRIYTHPRFLPPVSIFDSRIHQSLLSEGCRIERSEIRNSVVGLRSIIREGARISNSILMGADGFEAASRRGVALGVGKNCRIENAILDKNFRLGPGVKILNAKKVRHFDGPNYFIRDGIVVVPKNATLPAGTVI